MKWFNIRDAATQDSMYREAVEIPRKPYPSVEGIKATMSIYDSPRMRMFRALKANKGIVIHTPKMRMDIKMANTTCWLIQSPVNVNIVSATKPGNQK